MDDEVKISEVVAKLDGKRVLSCSDVQAFQSSLHSEPSEKIFFNTFHRYYLRPCTEHQHIVEENSFIFEVFKDDA